MSERQMAYISRRAVGVHDDEIVDEIVLPSIVRNRALGISGCLWFDEKRFFQVLEGDEGSVRSVYRKISIDDRHHDVTLLIDDPIAIRNFPRNGPVDQLRSGNRNRPPTAVTKYCRSHCGGLH